MKRFLSLFIATLMIISLLPAAAFAAELRTVYLDPANGLDTNNGLTEAAPVQTVAAAYAALEGADEGKIILLSTLSLTDVAVFPESNIPVTITGSGITTANHIYFSGDTTLENITLTLTATNNTRYISAQGHNLTIGTGVSCKNGGSGYRFCLASRHGSDGSVDGAVLTVKSGTWRNIFVAGHTNATTGDATLIMTGGDVNNMIAPSYSGNVNGNVTMQISGKTGAAAICCAPNQTGAVSGNVDITLGGNVAGYLRVKSLSGNAMVNGTATVTIDGDCTGLTDIKNVGDVGGGINKTRLVLKSGALDVTPSCVIDEISVEIPQGKTFTMQGITLTANTVNSAGTLIFSGAAALRATTVTGSLACEISGTVQENHVYLTAPANSVVTFPADSGVTGVSGVWSTTDVFNTETFKGLVLTTTVDGIVIDLYKGFSTDSANLLSPVHVEGKDQYYAVEAGAHYYCVSQPESGTGRYILHQTIYVTEAEAQQKTVLDMTPGVRTTSGWDARDAVCRFTDEVMQKAFPSNAALWPQYADIFTTPVFDEGRNDHRQSTQTEMLNFLRGLDGTDDNLYIYSLGKTAMGSFDVPVVIITSVDLSGAQTLEEAAALIREDSEKNNKVTVHYQAEIHGNEPAAGEAALGMIKLLDGTYGAGMVDNMNIYVIPRLNPYGAYMSKRVTWIDSTTYLDPNRDFMKLETSETQLRMKAFNLFDPDVVFDNHEYQFNLESTAVTKRDMMICSHHLPTHSQEYKTMAIDLAYAAFGQLEEDNLSYSWYSSDAQNYSISSVSAGVGSGNTALRGTFHILMETLGSNFGLNGYERRMAAHVSAVTGILDYLNENTAEVKATVKAERETIVQNGSTYEEDDIVIMGSSANYHPEYNIQGKKVNLRNGGEVNFTFEARMADTVTKSRVAPTAYVIPAGESYTQRVLDLMDMQGVSYQFIPADSVVLLQQYLGTITSGTVSATTLSEEMLVSFPAGAYVFTMNQVDAMILACYMEPDTGVSSDTLAKQGIITPINGEYPIYRYIHDLNEDGFIDYSSQGNSLKLAEDLEDLVLNCDLYVDLNGHNITGVVTGSYKLYIKDSATDDFEGAYGVVTGADNAANVVALDSYMMVAENGAVSVHKYEMQLQYVNISPSKKGISYTTTFHGDEKVKEQVKEFGIAMRLYYEPNATTIWADADGLTHVALKQSDWQTGNHSDAVKSVYIKNIVDWSLSDAENASRTAIPIYGRSYIQLQDGTMIFSDSVFFSMQSAMEEADRQWKSLDANSRQALVDLYLNPENHGFMQNWNLPNIKLASGETAS